MINLSKLRFFKSNGLPLTIQTTPLLTFRVKTSEKGLGAGAEGSALINRDGLLSSLEMTSNGKNYILSTQAIEREDGYFEDSLGPVSELDFYYSGTFIKKIDIANFKVLYKKNTYNLGYKEKTYYCVAKIEIDEDSLDNLYLNPIYYPGVSITGNIDLEPVSTNLVSCESIFILEKTDEKEAKTNKFIHKRPSSNVKNQRIAFSLNNRLIRFVTSDYVQEALIWKNKQIFSLEYDEKKETEPIQFTVGFLGDIEGVYEEFIQVYLVDQITDEDGAIRDDYTNIGMIHVGAEAIDEDERYRTLFTNFGIPDPIKYPTLFKEINPKEEGINWPLVNQKSKELFLTYTEIFPYVGTYKALINAVKFLGYTDIIFKEWFKYVGQDNQNSKYMAYQSMDISLGETLSSKLQKINLQNTESETDAWNTWFDYKKLNKLSMCYQINKETGDNEVIKGVSKSGSSANEFIFEVPGTVNTYEYSNEEVLIKLFALKDWLERYIIGVNCKITDITGEGVYFERFKNPAYATQYYTADYIKNIPLNPIPAISSDDDFTMLDSSAVVKCTMREFTDLTVGDFEQVSFSQFLNNAYSAEPSAMGIDSTGERNIIPKGLIDPLDDTYILDKFDVNNELHIPIGAPFNAPLLANELQYSLDIKTSSGTIVNSIKRTMDGSLNPIWIRDNEIYVYHDDVPRCEFEKCPTIQIADGVFRKKYGNINQSVVYRVNSAFDTEAQAYRYMMYKDTSANNYYLIDDKKYSRTKLVSYDYITLVPKENASFKYEISPKYEVPLFYIKNYDVVIYNTETYGENGDRILDASSSCYLGDSEFILDIYNGTITCDEGENLEAYINFSDEHVDISSGNTEQEVVAEYNYYSQKFNPWVFNVDKFMNGHGKLILSMTSDITALKNSASNRIFNAQMVIDSSRDASLDYIRIKNSSNPGWDPAKDKDYQYVIADASAKKVYVKDNISANFEHLKNLRVGQYEKAKLDLTKECYTINQFIDVSVNHIGKYDMSVKGWDQFGNIYANKSEKECHVYADAPNIFVSTPYSRSNNDKEFYAFNKNGKLVDISTWENANGEKIYSEEYKSFLSNQEPRFLPNTRIYGIDSSGLDLFTYPTNSYVIDTPKKDDYLLLENLTERVVSIDFDYKINVVGDSYERERTGLKLYILDENVDANNVFVVDASINLYFYDPIKMSLHYENKEDEDSQGIAGKYTVTGFFKAVQDNDEANNNYIQCVESGTRSQFKELNDELVEKVNSGKIKCFASNVSEYLIDADSIENDYDNNESTFKLSNTMLKNNFVFKKGQVIKIIFGKDAELGNNNLEDYIASASYRIKNVDVVNVAPLDEFGEPSGYIYKQVYTVEGIINKELITTGWFTYSKGGYQETYNDKITVRATYANSLYNQYILEARENTIESKGYGTVRFKNDWLIADYIDSTYSFNICKFIPVDAYNDWLSETKLLYADLYEYDIPASLMQGNQYRVTSRYKEKKALKEYKSIWSLYTNTTQKMNRLRWQVINPFIYARATQKGEYKFKLEAVDIYGNLVINEGEAVMFAKSY